MRGSQELMTKTDKSRNSNGVCYLEIWNSIAEGKAKMMRVSEWWVY